MDLPIACTLSDAEMRERRQTILDVVRAALEVAPLPLGYAFRFSPTSEVLERLCRLVDLERKCCPFLTFKIVVEPANQPICLEITGPPDAKAVISEFFNA